MTLSVDSNNDISLNCDDLNSVDQREASLLLNSLGKKYYKMSGMGRSLQIDKLRELRDRDYTSHLDYSTDISFAGQTEDRKKATSRNEMPRGSSSGSRYCSLEMRLSRSDATKHFPFEDKVPIPPNFANS